MWASHFCCELLELRIGVPSQRLVLQLPPAVVCQEKAAATSFLCFACVATYNEILCYFFMPFFNL